MSEPRTFTVTAGEDPKRTPVRVVVVQGDARPPVDATDEPMVMTYPHLVVRELIAFLALSLGLIVVSLFADAPLEEIADPTRTPNPAKAPWYFLGLQELLHYYPPLVSGVVMPGLLILALVIIPYFPVNIVRSPLDQKALPRIWGVIVVASAIFYFTGSQPVWPFIGTLAITGAAMSAGVVSRSSHPAFLWLRSRSLPFWLFSWFLFAATVLTIIGVFFRGPGWRFTLPWRDGIYY